MRPRFLKMILIPALAVFFAVSASGAAETVKIMAANLTSGNQQAYEEPGMNILQGLQPDIVLIQEFNYESGSIYSFVNTVFGPGFSYYRESGKSLPNGIVSRWPIKSSGSWNDPELSDREFAWAVIDIPGNQDLQAVSVHFKAGDSSSDRTTRRNQALALESYIEDHFDPGQYIVVGGDLNTQDRNEDAIAVLNGFLRPLEHIPRDQTLNSFTNLSRTKPYDWVIPNALLDLRHQDLIIGGNSFPEGLVFDSWYYDPLTEVPPVEKGDSRAPNMQHMAVLKAYAIPVPSPSPAPAASPTPYPGSDLVIPGGDYDGDGTSEIAIFRPSAGRWLVRGLTTAWFGAASDLPAPGDYEGNGTTGIAVFRPSTGLWLIRGLTRVYFGSGSDRPVPGDYDGDSTAEIAVFRPASALWLIRGLTRVYFGGAQDRVVPGDYDGDGSWDPAVFRPASALWLVRSLTRVYYGGSTDQPLPGDYTGDEAAEIAVYRGAYGLWLVRGTTRFYYGGAPADFPLPADLGGDGTAEAVIFRPASGLWLSRAVTRLYYGKEGDIPLTR